MVRRIRDLRKSAIVKLPSATELEIATIGTCGRRSPLRGGNVSFVDEARRVLLCTDLVELRPFLEAGEAPPAFEPAGPRAKIHFDPRRLVCGIVTCGGLCPGLNSVIRSIVRILSFAFEVRCIYGFRYGYAGLAAREGHEPIMLTPERVDRIHEYGGTILGSSRGPQDAGEMVDTLARLKVGALFAIGGDGTHRGASAIADEIGRRGLPIAVVGVPKTIDNDIAWTERSFGFSTAVEAARQVLEAAHEEARGAWNGIGLVKLMGRHSGFIAAHASLANSDVNFCLVPEVPLVLDGERGFLAALERRLDVKHHAVVVVAEGVGQDLLQDPAHAERDASGNLRLKDIGVYLRERIVRHFAQRGKKTAIKYIDPSYAIRSLPANAVDAESCLSLGQHAVHAAMAGRTRLMVGQWRQRFVHVPMALVIHGRRRIEPEGELWQRVLDATGQAAAFDPLDAGEGT